LTSYADTSFAVSLYVPDIHSSRAIAAMAKMKGAVLITALVEVELCNSIELRRFRKELTAREAKSASWAFEQDIQTGVFSVQPIPASAFENARRLARKHTASLGTRSLDLLHVASALTLGAATLYSFDVSQRKLAQAAGLTLGPRTVAQS
jgi:predicted nucleic acid-binding protein